MNEAESGRRYVDLGGGVRIDVSDEAVLDRYSTELRLSIDVSDEDARDRRYSLLADGLRRGWMTIDQVRHHLDNLSLRDWAQPEDVKILLRTALMSANFRGPMGFGTAAWALVAREVGLRCTDRRISYGLAVGSADAVAAADYVAGLLFFQYGDFRSAMPHFTELADLAMKEEDFKGVVEALGDIGTAHFLLGNYDVALSAFQDAQLLCARLPQRDVDLAETFSTQRMVRHDNRNVFNFNIDRNVPEISSIWAAVWYLLERISSCQLKLNRIPEALRASSEAVAIWREQSWKDPKAGMRVLHTHVLVLEAANQRPAARTAAKELRRWEKRTRGGTISPLDRLSTTPGQPGSGRDK